MGSLGYDASPVNGTAIQDGNKIMAMGETMEPRVLFSATAAQVSAAVAAYHKYESAITVDIKKLTNEVNAAFKPISADLSKAGAKSSGGPLVTTASTLAKNLVANFNKTYHPFAGTLLKQATKTGKDGKALLKKPTNTALSAKVAADLSSLTTSSTAAVQAFGTSGDFTALYPAIQGISQAALTNTKLSSDIAKAVSTFTTLEHQAELDEANLALRGLIGLEVLFEA